MTKTKEVGARLKAFREYLGYKQEDMAQKIGIPASTYARYEQGAFSPKINVISPLSEYLLNFDWLITGTGPMLRTEREKEIIPIDDSTLIDVSVMVEREYNEQGINPDARTRGAVVASVYDIAVSGGIDPDTLRRIIRREVKRAYK